MLVIGGILAALVAVRLVAAIAGWEVSSLNSVASAWGYAVRAALLCVALVVLAALIAAVIGRGQRSLWLRGERGGVLVSLEALQRLAEATALGDPDVVRAEAHLRDRDGAPYGSMHLYARPLADAARVRRDVEAEVRAAIDLLIGREAAQVAVKPTVLRVSQLKKHLP